MTPPGPQSVAATLRKIAPAGAISNVCMPPRFIHSEAILATMPFMESSEPSYFPVRNTRD
jgi:hypothetical protein